MTEETLNEEMDERGEMAASAQMPEKLREILSEPGWVTRKDGWLYTYRIPNSFAHIEIHKGELFGKWFVLFANEKVATAATIITAAPVMQRIERALSAGAGAGEEG